MMSSTQKLSVAVDAARGCEAVVSEDVGRLSVSGALCPQAADAWRVAGEDAPDWLTITCRDRDHQEVPITATPADEMLCITVAFKPPSGAAFLFSSEGWNSLLLSEGFDDCREVRLAFIDEGFATLACPILPWRDEAPAASDADAATTSTPRRYVRSHSPALMAPRDVEHWILREHRGASSAVDASWRTRAAEMLVRALPNDLYCEGGVASVILAGQPQRRLKLGFPAPATLKFDELQRAVRWVYLEGNDTEVRHTFLASELAREWREEATFADGLALRLPAALEAAELLYKAHLRSGSKDTLKALADLRKTLSDDVQKLLQQAKDLASSVWRDTAVVVGAAALRLITAASSPPNSAFGWVFLCVALYVGVSYGINRATNDGFIRIMEESRRTWRGKLYGFLDEADYRALAERPLGDALARYRAIRCWTDIIIACLVLLLVLFALVEFSIIDLSLILDRVLGLAWLLAAGALDALNTVSQAIPKIHQAAG